MLIQTFILVSGLALLYAGSYLLVEGSVSVAVLFSLRPVIIGLTIVSLATSAPELLVSLVAAIKGSGGISIGNVIGSNVINIALVLGISAAIRPVTIKKQIVKVDLPFMVIISVLFWVLCLDSKIGRFDGILLLLSLSGFITYGIITARDTGNDSTRPDFALQPIIKSSLFIIIGLIMLAYGANLVVREAIAFALQLGLSQTFIGISIVALGTSLPELATSAVASSKGQSDISVGNVVGSNLFNICLVMGTVGLFNPMSIDQDLLSFQFPFMIFVSIALYAIAGFQKCVSKRSGCLLIILFIAYIFISYIK